MFKVINVLKFYDWFLIWHRFTVCYIAFLLLLLPRIISGQSIYSAAGIGEIRNFISGRSNGMGGVGLALVDDIMYNIQNPAAGAFLQNTSLSSGFMFEGLNVGQKGSKFSNRLSRWNGFSLSIKINQRIDIAGGLVPFSDFYYGMALADEGRGYRRSLKGEGGLSRGFGAAAVRIFPNFSIGLMVSRYFGILQEEFIVNYDEISFYDTENTQRTNVFGNSIRIGGLFQHNKYSLGGYYSLSSNLSGKSEFEPGPLLPITVTHFPVRIPAMWGVGSMINVSQRWKAGLDIQWTMFKTLHLGNTIQKFDDSYRIAAGTEYTPLPGLNPGYFSKTRYQFGIYTQKLYIRDVNGSAIHEYGFTLGFGFPFNLNYSRIDLSLDIGTRGSKTKNFVQERFMRIGLQIGVRERWFERRRERERNRGKSSEETQSED